MSFDDKERVQKQAYNTQYQHGSTSNPSKDKWSHAQ